MGNVGIQQNKDDKELSKVQSNQSIQSNQSNQSISSCYCDDFAITDEKEYIKDNPMELAMNTSITQSESKLRDCYMKRLGLEYQSIMPIKSQKKAVFNIEFDE